MLSTPDRVTAPRRPRPGQLLVRLGGRQRLVRVGADRGRARRCRSCAASPAALLAPMNFSIFYDNRAQTACNTNASLPGDQPTGQHVRRLLRRAGHRPATTTARCTPIPGSPCTSGWACTRCPATSGGGPGGRCRRSAAPPTRTSPAQGQWPTPGYWQTYTDPQSGTAVRRLGGPLRLSRDLAHLRPDVRRRHVRGPDGQPGRPRDRPGAPTASGWTTCAGPRSRSATPLRSWAIRCGACRRPAPPTTPAATAATACEGLAFGHGEGLAQCARPTCATEDAVTPHASVIALPVIPQAAYANIAGAARPLPGDLHRRRRLL